ncbi:MAG: glucose 1-dehydrogenase [Solirubrobacteraceae bacterium]|jgi:NAD(P)-dependent dehydrogenase (short-subunit alcohol dehydrogenase family)
MDYGLHDRVALVTGAASGIGLATARAFATLGARVVASDVDEVAGEAAVLSIGDAGGEAVFVAADVTDAAAVGALVAAAVEAYGRLDCAANCAGVGGGEASTHDYPPERFDRILEVNLRGTWLAVRAQIDALLAQGSGGAIVNVSSTLGLRGSPYGAPYSASKHGVLGLTRSAALEYAAAGIRINAVCPGAIDTPMMDETFARFPGFRETLIGFVPLGRLGRPDEVADAIAWLCSDAASFITGEALAVEGGLLSR